MALHIFLSSSLRKAVPDYTPEMGIRLEAPPGATVAWVCEKIGIAPEAVKVSMVDGRARPLQHPLKGTERIGLFPPIGGG